MPKAETVAVDRGTAPSENPYAYCTRHSHHKGSCWLCRRARIYRQGFADATAQM